MKVAGIKKSVVESVSQNLRASALRGSLSVLPQSIFVIDVANRIVYINHPPPGYPDADLQGSDIFAVTPSEYNQIVSSALESVFRYNQVFTLNRVEYKQKWFHVYAAPVQLRKKKAAAVILTEITDETHHSQRIEALSRCMLSFSTEPQKNIQLLTSLTGQLFNATWALYSKIQDGLLCTREKWHTPPDYNPIDKPYGHICYDVITENADAPKVVCDLPATHYARTDPNIVAYNLKTYIGTAVRFAESRIGSLCVVFDRDYYPHTEDLNIMRLIANAIGIEEDRHQNLAKLKQSRRNFQTIFESAADFIVLLDPQGRILDANEQMCRTLGYSLDELRQTNIMALHTPSEEEDVRRHIAELDTTGQFCFESALVAKGGEKIPLEVSSRVVNINGTEHLLNIGRDLRLRKKVEQQLRQSLTEKETLLEELHHRVKNNLQLVSSLLAARFHDSRNIPNEQILQSCQNAITAMGLVHDRLYKSRNLSRIDFSEYLETLTYELFKSFAVNQGRTINLRLLIRPGCHLNIRQAIPCALIANELLSNSIKHAFVPGTTGTITVMLSFDSSGNVRFTIADDGRGLPPGINIENPSTSGLKLVKLLATQLNAGIQLTTDGRTKYCLRFKNSQIPIREAAYAGT